MGNRRPVGRPVTPAVRTDDDAQTEPWGQRACYFGDRTCRWGWPMGADRDPEPGRLLGLPGRAGNLGVTGDRDGRGPGRGNAVRPLPLLAADLFPQGEPANIYPEKPATGHDRVQRVRPLPAPLKRAGTAIHFQALWHRIYHAVYGCAFALSSPFATAKPGFGSRFGHPGERRSSAAERHRIVQPWRLASPGHPAKPLHGCNPALRGGCLFFGGLANPPFSVESLRRCCWKGTDSSRR